ncbi:MAG: DUF2282 domain-containing protein [Dongiaceae bacterium]
MGCAACDTRLGDSQGTRSGITLAALTAAVAAALAMADAQAQQNVPKPAYKFEKCFGIVRAGQNDCFSPSHSCGGTASRNNDPQSWIYLPAGTCAKIKGGSTGPGKS